MGLKDLSAVNFVKVLASKEPTPGGGSVAALVGANGVGLLLMVASYIEDQNAIRSVWEPFEKAKNNLLDLVDLDALSFDTYMKAAHLPKITEEEKKSRSEKMQEAITYASQIPFRTMKACFDVIPFMDILMAYCKKNMISDLGAAATSLRASIESAYLNIIINAYSIKDPNVSSQLLSDANQMKDSSVQKLDSIYQNVVLILAPHS